VWRRTGFLIVALALFAGWSSRDDRAAAAVGVCQDPMTGGPQAAPSEAAGRKAALAAWVRAVSRVHGERYTSWRLAFDKSLTCKVAGDGSFSCEACGRPCTVEQVPQPGLDRLPRIDPTQPQKMASPPSPCPAVKGLKT